MDKLKNISSVQAFGLGISSREIEKKIQTPQYDLKVTLNDVWSSIGDKYKGILIIIDDLDTVTNEKKIMLTLRNSLMEAIMDKTKVACVVSGAEKLFEGFEKAHGPLVRFFEPFILGNLSNEESREAIRTPLKNSGIIFDESVMEKVITMTQGQPYYLQEFCYYLFNNSIEGKVTTDIYEASYSNIMHDIATKIWNQKIRQFGDTNTKILHIISNGSNSTSEIENEAKKRFGITTGTVRTALSRMQREGKIEKNKRGSYDVSDTLFKQHLERLF